MPIRARIPSLSDWKAQVKCQSGCPVSTDAGRYVQLIAENRDEEAFFVARAPNPFASGLRPGLRRAVRGRLPAWRDRRPGLDPRPEAVRHRAVRRASIRPNTQDRLFGELVGEGNRYAGHLPVVPSPAPAPASGKTRVAVIGAGPAGLWATRPRASRLRRDRLRGRRRAGRDDAVAIAEYRLPRTLIKAEIDRILALGVTLRLGTALSPPTAWPSCAAAASRPSFSRSASQRGGTSTSRASSWTVW